jgi:hypothetical protein
MLGRRGRSQLLHAAFSQRDSILAASAGPAFSSISGLSSTSPVLDHWATVLIATEPLTSRWNHRLLWRLLVRQQPPQLRSGMSGCSSRSPTIVLLSGDKLRGFQAASFKVCRNHKERPILAVAPKSCCFDCAKASAWHSRQGEFWPEK